MSYVPANANRDLWTMLGFLVAGVVALAWSALRENGEAPPEDSADLPETPAGETRPGNGTPHIRLS